MRELSCDVCVVGTGAGGAVAAALLARAGLDVVILEEGRRFSAEQLTQREAELTSELYQNGMLRSTRDGGVVLLQGRAVGGSTLVNWATCFRLPERVLTTWQRQHGVAGLGYEDLISHFEAVEARLHIRAATAQQVNGNNRKLLDGSRKLGWKAELVQRNALDCAGNGSCGLGCPINAKRSTLVTFIEDAQASGARLLPGVRAQSLEMQGDRIVAVQARETLALPADGRPSGSGSLRVRAKTVVLSCGALNTPALLLRSGLPSANVGKRTFLHPAVVGIGVYPSPVDAHEGVPQSVACTEFSERGSAPGVLIEATPVYPAMLAAMLPGIAADHRELMLRFRNLAVHVGLVIDGFDGDAGGQVRLSKSGEPLLDYRLDRRLQTAFSFAQARIAELQIASGAQQVLTLHEGPPQLASDAALKSIAKLKYGPGHSPIFSAHVLGGCAMGDDSARSVVRSRDLRHHQLANLYVFDGSVFPTGLGVNPMQTISSLSHLMTTRLLATLAA